MILSDTRRIVHALLPRRRRCGGWLNLVKHQASLINGYDYDTWNLTKLGILAQLPEIKVAFKYIVNGKELSGFSTDLDVLAKVDVEYCQDGNHRSKISVPTMARPENCKDYIEFIEYEEVKQYIE